MNQTTSVTTNATSSAGSAYTVTPEDWPMTNYDNAMSRYSPQTAIGRDNVDQLQVKWILNTEYTVEAPPLIVGDTGYVENNGAQVIAFDLNTGTVKWFYDTNVTLVAGASLPRVSTAHGMTYENGTLYVPTIANGTIVALNAETGERVWESPNLQNGSAWRISAPPLICNDVIIAGSALGDDPPFGFPARGTVTGVSKENGSMLWQTETAVGAWVTGNNTTMNGGATTWSGGAVDEEKGVVYLPVGNAAPDFNAETRPGANNYTSNVIAVDCTNGSILWATPFVANGTIFPVQTPDTHDWDTAWGTNLVTVNTSNGTTKYVIGHDKHGDIAAMNPDTGEIVWWKNLAITMNDNSTPTQNGSPVTWPGPGDGIEAYTAADDNGTVYAAVSNQGMIFSTLPSPGGSAKPAFDAMPNGIGNGSVVALDAATGNIKWQYDTYTPTWCSPLVTNGVVFSGNVSTVGTPYEYSAFGGPTWSPKWATGSIFALDADTGNELWRFQLGSQASVGGPSIGNGVLLVPAGGIQTQNPGGYVVAFGLPGGNTSTTA